MSIVITAITRVEDWGPPLIERVERLAGCACRAGATRQLVFRNVHDASQALLLIELPGHDALRLLSVEMAERLDPVAPDCAARFRVWEPVIIGKQSR